MPVDAELQPILDLIAASEGPAPTELGPVGLRELFDLMCGAFGTGPDGVQATDLTLDGRDGPIPARRYRPGHLAGADAAGAGAAPALVYLHGGGFVIGSLDTHDTLCRNLADAAGVVVVSVAYRLAPEHPAPAAVRDADDALAAVIERATELGVDRDRIAVGGDSAGANLAAVAAIHHRHARRSAPDLPALRFQLLLYPVVDMTLDLQRFPSLVDNGEGYFLTLETMEFFGHHYLAGSAVAPTSPDVSPIRTEDLAGLPAAFVLTAELDPLRDEGEAYAARLAASGVAVEARRYDGAIHGFVQMSGITSIGRRALDECAAALRSALAPGQG